MYWVHYILYMRMCEHVHNVFLHVHSCILIMNLNMNPELYRRLGGRSKAGGGVHPRADRREQKRETDVRGNPGQDQPMGGQQGQRPAPPHLSPRGPRRPDAAGRAAAGRASSCTSSGAGGAARRALIAHFFSDRYSSSFLLLALTASHSIDSSFIHWVHRPFQPDPILSVPCIRDLLVLVIVMLIWGVH